MRSTGGASSSSRCEQALGSHSARFGVVPGLPCSWQRPTLRRTATQPGVPDSCCAAAPGRPAAGAHACITHHPCCPPAAARLPQDFEFPAGCQRIKVTPDGQYIFASGYHPPQVLPGLVRMRLCTHKRLLRRAGRRTSWWLGGAWWSRPPDHRLLRCCGMSSPPAGRDAGHTHAPRPALPDVRAVQMRCYDVQQLSMKFDRHLDSEIVDFQILSEDYSKAVFLCADRRQGGAALGGGGAAGCCRVLPDTSRSPACQRRLAVVPNC